MIPSVAAIIPSLHFFTSSSLPPENISRITMIKRYTTARSVTTFFASLAMVIIRYFAPFSPVKSPPKKNPQNVHLNDSMYPSRVVPLVASYFRFKSRVVGSAKVVPKNPTLVITRRMATVIFRKKGIISKIQDKDISVDSPSFTGIIMESIHKNHPQSSRG